ncbi:hypothetical protein GCM10011402_32130 [Paracoccus acridae]|uniref:Phage portal protein n=1 Tax=Paracoccus acridae TaxID=1795310 RepID=A0ABQ1VMP7_9RHOB|nr:hypothetical protein [Paracoccus acridae]GGF77017.1 hypothetical protein GCM10011402_32130 [Paracoccus acridae]
MTVPGVTPVRATTLSPLHYHSLPVPSGTATIAEFLADRSMSYAIANAMGALSSSVALPRVKDYRRDLEVLPWMASVFTAVNPSLLPQIGKRLNLDSEGGYQKKIMDATGTGNLKTWFYIQEVAPGTIYEGAIFGPDPFLMASEADGRKIDYLIIRTGRHLGGIVKLERAPDVAAVRLNAHTAHLFGQDPATDPNMEVDVFALYDMQFTSLKPLEDAARIVGSWRTF